MPIIVSRGGQGARRIQETGIADENYLQQYIAANPDALPIDDIKENVRLMIVGREFHTQSGPIDVLAVDGDGDIYLIETKLYKNPDKRTVIAQVLDYGAALWRGYSDVSEFIGDVDRFMIRQTGEGFNQNLGAFFGYEEEQLGDFTDTIRSQLGAGNFRFVILMDQLSARLKDLILFMNERTAFDIYAVEMEFYQHEGLEIVIPKLFGAQVTKSVTRSGERPQGRLWDEESFFEDLEAKNSPQAVEAARKILEWTKQNADYVAWGRGSQTGSFVDGHEVEDTKYNIFAVYTYGKTEIYFQHLMKKPPFDDETKRLELRDRLNAIDGVAISAEAVTKRPSIALDILAPAENMSEYCGVLDWVLGEIKTHSSRG